MNTILLIVAIVAAMLCPYFLRESDQHCFPGRYAHGFGTRHSGKVNLLYRLLVPVWVVLAVVLLHLIVKGSFGLFGWEIPVAAAWAILSEFRFFCLKTGFPPLQGIQDLQARREAARQRAYYAASCAMFLVSVLAVCACLWLVFGASVWGRLLSIGFAALSVGVFFCKKW